MVKIKIEEDKQPQNIFVRGNIVIAQCGNIIMVTENSPPESQVFSGVVLYHVHNPIGFYCENWDKYAFKQFHGKITLES